MFVQQFSQNERDSPFLRFENRRRICDGGWFSDSKEREAIRSRLGLPEMGSAGIFQGERVSVSLATKNTSAIFLNTVFLNSRGPVYRAKWSWFTAAFSKDLDSESIYDDLAYFIYEKQFLLKAMSNRFPAA